jgi:hypothetical protein
MKRILGLLSVSILAVAASSAAASGETAPQGPVQVQPPAAVRGMAAAPKAPGSAKQGTSVGKGKATANTANAPGDGDSIWVEQVDVDGDGNVDQASVLWDDEDKVLYLYKEGTFTCRNGGTGDGGVLVAIYGTGNTRKAPVGSGWYAVELDKSECGAQAAGLFGCKFDAQGNATACGVAVVDDKNDDVVITVVSK